MIGLKLKIKLKSKGENVILKNIRLNLRKSEIIGHIFVIDSKNDNNKSLWGRGGIFIIAGSSIKSLTGLTDSTVV